MRELGQREMCDRKIEGRGGATRAHSGEVCVISNMIEISTEVMLQGEEINTEEERWKSTDNLFSRRHIFMD